MSRSRLLPAILIFALAACSSRAPADGLDGPRPDRNLLTSEELLSHPQTDLLHAIKLLRPHWKGQVFMDGYPIGSMEELRMFTPAFAKSVEYLRPSEAGARFGLQLNSGPAIAVTSRR